MKKLEELLNMPDSKEIVQKDKEQSSILFKYKFDSSNRINNFYCIQKQCFSIRRKL
jgi:hypothetical protein